ncbi:ABC transporter permease [Arenicella sp. 4NH20-0111]|uniref:ABC transporter permease n=1 Tax=Arenicella sp. 4NH20-0111 TaxID=3127648 RepID=UPI003104706B
MSSAAKALGKMVDAFTSIDVKDVIYPFLGIIIFLFIWNVSASRIDTSLGQFPGPKQVYQQSLSLIDEHNAEQVKKAAFYERQDKRNAKKAEKNPNAVIKVRKYTGKETFFDQIFTSLKTVLFGFFIASAIAIPLGIACGLSDAVYKGMNPLIQIFKPVSPLAWLPLITMVVSALYVTDDPYFEKSFLNSALTVALCCLWPTLINTAVGVANVDKDLLNVSRVIQLPALTHVRKIILPASIPMIFTGLRLSLATGWMVLIAAEMLSQNPGLGKFVWDEFQNGSSNSLSRIMVAVVVIGLIGFALDRLILMAQRFVSWDKQAILR